MPNTEAVEKMVKAFSETPAKVQEKEITIKMMMQPIDLNYTVSVHSICYNNYIFSALFFKNIDIFLINTC